MKKIQTITENLALFKAHRARRQAVSTSSGDPETDEADAFNDWYYGYAPEKSGKYRRDPWTGD